MKCPYCGSSELRVLDTRPTSSNTMVHRRRECCACRRRWSTYEVRDTRYRDLFRDAATLNDIRALLDRRPHDLGDIEPLP